MKGHTNVAISLLPVVPFSHPFLVEIISPLLINVFPAFTSQSQDLTVDNCGFPLQGLFILP